MFAVLSMCQTDGECVRGCLDGQPEMFRQLVLRYQVPLVKHLAGRLGDDNEAAEAAQETMVRAYFALPKLKKVESFYAWLLGIAERVARETQRTRGRRIGSLDVESVPDRTEVVTDQGLCPDGALSRAVAELPEAHRQVVLLRFYGGLSCAEISRNLDVPLGTVTSRLSRAYALLREALRTCSHQGKDLEVE